MIKNIILAVIMLLFINFSLLAQVPARINFQGVLMDNNGNPLTGSYNLELRLHEAISGGTAIWTEMHSSVPVNNGVFNIILGNFATLSAITFDKTYYVEVKVGNDPPLQPRVELTNVPYSFMAKNIEDNTISTNKIQNNAVTTPKVSDNSITTPKIMDGAVTQSKLAGNVSLPPGGTAGGDLTGSYPNPIIASNAITTAKIQDGSVTSAKILDGTISAADIGNTQVVKALNNLRDNVSIVGSGNTSVNTSGSTITVSSSGGSGTVTQVNTGAGLTGGPISTTGTISIPNSGITESMLQNNSVTSAKIVDGTVAAADIASNAITTAKIQDQAVTGSKISVPLLLSALGTTNVLSVMNTTGDAILTTVSTGTGIRSQVSSSGVAGRFLGGTGAGIRVENNNSSTDAAQIQSLGTGNSSALYLWNNNSSMGYSTIYAWNNISTGYSGYFRGRVHVDGILSKSSGTFKIDHPLDPSNKFLNHSFVESPDMMNVYNGNVVLDGKGEAIVVLPNYFESLNMDYRYQLTPIGAPGPNLYIANEISNNSFSISGGTPNSKVSWQVTGVRNDPYAQKNRIIVEENKNPEERGKYLNPEAYNMPQELGITYQRTKEAQDRIEEERR